MARQLSFFGEAEANLRQFEPVSVAREGAARYTGGRHSIEGLENVTADRPRAFKIQQAYRAAQASPEHPKIRRSYEAMRHEVGNQYAFMTKPKEEGGMGIKHTIHDEEPYGFHWAGGNDKTAAHAMAADVAKGQIKTLSTKATGGHEYFSDEENDRFRAVHDVFGHAATGRGFSRNGEEAAYLSHRQMFPRVAQQAVASETRGQNSYLNYRPAKDPEKNFPDQGPGSHLVGLPSFAQRVRRNRGA